MAEYPTDSEVRASFAENELDSLVNAQMKSDTTTLATITNDSEHGDRWNAEVMHAVGLLAIALHGEITSQYSDLRIVRPKLYAEVEADILQSRKWKIHSERRAAEAAAAEAAAE